MTNTPIGIPSGWEEIAANRSAMNLKFLSEWSWFDNCCVKTATEVIFCASLYSTTEHDWRVVE